MLIAVSTDAIGEKSLILGLEAENIERLLNDQPIQKILASEGFYDLQVEKVVILGPEDTVRWVTHFGIKAGESVKTEPKTKTQTEADQTFLKVWKDVWG